MFARVPDRQGLEIPKKSDSFATSWPPPGLAPPDLRLGYRVVGQLDPTLVAGHGLKARRRTVLKLGRRAMAGLAGSGSGDWSRPSEAQRPRLRSRSVTNTLV